MNSNPQELAREIARRIKSALGLTLQFVTVEDLQEIIFPEINTALDAERQATSNAFSAGYDQGHSDALAAKRRKHV
jgi:hypothetical protein